MGMSFQTQLEQLLKDVDGSVACSVMGFDGIAIETQQSSDPGVDLASMLVEYGSILSKLKEAAKALEAGSVNEVAISTDKLSTIARLLTPEYFLVLALTPSGNFGKGRYALRVAAPKVKAELG
jgi:predicted regulator of Ras-like GTPase activity (Roadblock/LC7/MglB family)